MHPYREMMPISLWKARTFRGRVVHVKRKLLVFVYGAWLKRFARETCEMCGWRSVSRRVSGNTLYFSDMFFHRLQHARDRNVTIESQAAHDLHAERLNRLIASIARERSLSRVEAIGIIYKYFDEESSS